MSEVEIQNILAHYKRLGKNEDRYIESFDNIAAQYNDTQLRIISKFLPLNVRAVLEERSPKYQQIMSFNSKVSDTIRKPKVEDDGTSEKLLKLKTRENIMTGPVVIPSSVNMSGAKKLSRVKHVEQPITEEIKNNNVQNVSEQEIYTVMPGLEEITEKQQETTVEPVQEETIAPVKRGRGRPRKNPVTLAPELPLEPEVQEEQTPKEQAQTIEEFEPILPGLNEEPISNYNSFNNVEQDKVEIMQDSILPGISGLSETPNYNMKTSNTINSMNSISSVNSMNSMGSQIEEIDISGLLSSDKKIVSFVGTSKNGTSFIVNNLAEMLSTAGINVAILDTTKNRNSYYIYTNNEEELRKIAMGSLEGLVRGSARGIEVHKNLTVYTSLPDENEYIEHSDKILETLLKKHSLILIDTDFKTPTRYFEQSQEIYLVQTMDVMTIQPLTAFLRELKARNILEDKKLKIVLNKVVKLRGITDKTIIGGMAYYNDPSMSFMTELFDRTLIKYIAIPFEEETYIRYLENVIECNVSLKGYSKGFLQALKELGNMVYPTTGTYRPPTARGYSSQTTFSPGMAQTLDQMKNNY